jgi:hypothetical protein
VKQPDREFEICRSLESVFGGFRWFFRGFKAGIVFIGVFSFRLMYLMFDFGKFLRFGIVVVVMAAPAPAAVVLSSWVFRLGFVGVCAI